MSTDRSAARVHDSREGVPGQPASTSASALPRHSPRADLSAFVRFLRWAAAIVLTVPLTMPAQNAWAETLYDAFRAAHDTNPTIEAQRAAVRIGEQDRAISQTGFAPYVGLNSDYAYHDRKGIAPGYPQTELTSHPRGFGGTLTQNVWNGFKTVNSVARDDALVSSRRDDLIGAKQSVLVDAATAYVDVLRDKDVLELRRNNTVVLGARAKQTRYLFQIGQMTRTDVDQSDASLARGYADIAIAKSNLDTSRAVFRSVVGHDPGRLEPAGVPLAMLPKSLEEAIGQAMRTHPAVRAAAEAVTAAEINIDVEKAGYLPSLDVSLSADRRWAPDTYQAKTILDQATVMGRLTIPLYDQGLTPASVHRATEVRSQRMAELDHQRAVVRASVVENWEVFRSSATVISSALAQIVASDRALAGIEIEASVGQRTTMDVLITQQSLLDARVNLEVAERDRTVAGFRLLASVGQLSLDALRPQDLRRNKPYQPLAFPAVMRRDPVATGSVDALGLRSGFPMDSYSDRAPN